MFSKKVLGAAVAATAMMLGQSAFAAGTSASTMTVSATLTDACLVSATSAISFGSFAALVSTGDQTADSGTSFTVACSSTATPTIYSVTERKMTHTDGTTKLPFSLGLTNTGTGLAATTTGDTLPTITQDGTAKEVKIYAKVLADDFKALKSGAYSTTVSLVVAY